VEERVLAAIEDDDVARSVSASASPPSPEPRQREVAEPPADPGTPTERNDVDAEDEAGYGHGV